MNDDDLLLLDLLTMLRPNQLVQQCKANTRTIQESPYYHLGPIDKYIKSNMGIIPQAMQLESQSVNSFSTQEIKNNLFQLVDECQQCLQTRDFKSFVVIRGKVNDSSNNRLCLINIDRLYRLDQYDIKLFNVMSQICGKSVNSLLPYQIKATLYPNDMERSTGSNGVPSPNGMLVDDDEGVSDQSGLTSPSQGETQSFRPGDCIYGKYTLLLILC